MAQHREKMMVDIKDENVVDFQREDEGECTHGGGEQVSLFLILILNFILKILTG
jgi:hypothetical protein